MMHVLRNLRRGSQLLGIGMLGLALQGGLGSGAVGAAPIGPLTVTINSSPVPHLAPATVTSTTPALAFTVGVTGATANAAIQYLDTINGSQLC